MVNSIGSNLNSTMIQPFLTDCGHYLCYTCRGRLLASGRDQCPECREPNGAKDARLNKHLQRQVNSLKVRCRHHEVGCQWVGELMYLKEHLDPLLRRCGFILLVCPLGCGERVRSSAMEEHIRSNCSIVEFRLLPIEFTITDFLKMKESNTEWVSPPFYTHPHGYKVCLVVYPNGIDMGEGSHVSVFVGLLKGEHDDQLGWPLELDFAIELLNWREDKGHYEHTVTINSEYYRVTKNGIKMSPNVLLFIHRSLLSYNSSTDTEYLQNNSLRLRVNRATMHSTPFVAPAPSWLEPSKVSQSVCEFTLTEFSKRKELKNRFFSPSFYTHQNGYKMCLIVCANGEFHGKGTHVTVYVQLLAGVNDDQLQWPFTGDIILELVNWREDKGHHSKTLSIGVVSGLDKVTEGTAGMTAGLSQFISHSCLSYNCSTNTEYLHKDSLHLRVKQVVVYFTPLLLKDHPISCSRPHPGKIPAMSSLSLCVNSHSLNSQNAPECREPNGAKDARLNKHLQRQVNSLKVRCRHHEVGCQWVGELMYLKEHLDPLLRRCGFILLVCPLGCGERVRSSAMEEHIRSNCSIVEFRLLPIEFTITDFLKMKESNTEWVSPPFYTHPHGYKVCLVVYPNGIDMGEGSHVSVFVGLLKGEHDDQLGWPLELDFAIELLNWREDKGHYEHTVTINSEYYRVTKNGIKMSPNVLLFIHRSLLSYNSSTDTEYLQNNSLRLRVNRATMHSTPFVAPAPSWLEPSKVSQSVCEFTLTEFSKRKELKNRFFSPSFYTHQNGYKMCLIVCANGEFHGKGTHVTVYVQLLAGVNDDQLQWPFTGDIILELVNWREDKGHHSKTHLVTILVSVEGRTEESILELLAFREFSQCEFTH